MKKAIKRIDYSAMVANTSVEDNKIGDEIHLLDDYRLDPVFQYEFTSEGNGFIEVLEGEGTITVNSNTYKVVGPCLIIYLTGQTVTTSITSKKCIQRSAVFSDHFMEDMYMSALKFNDIRSTILQNPVILMDDELVKSVEVYVNVLRDIASKKDNPNGLICAKYVTLALFYGPLFKSFKKKVDAVTFRSPKLSSEFFSILEKHFREEHKMSFYAQQLNISERYLYVSVVSTTGKSPNYWVEYYIVSEAKKLLANRELSIQQVCKVLHYAGLPSFGKFFKRKEGMSPMAYRKAMTRNNN